MQSARGRGIVIDVCLSVYNRNNLCISYAIWLKLAKDDDWQDFWLRDARRGHELGLLGPRDIMSLLSVKVYKIFP